MHLHMRKHKLSLLIKYNKASKWRIVANLDVFQYLEEGSPVIQEASSVLNIWGDLQAFKLCVEVAFQSH